MYKSNIFVGVRIRPPLPREINSIGTYSRCILADGKKVFVSLSGQQIIIDGDSNDIPDVAQYVFDCVFDNNSKQEDIYKIAIEDSVKDFIHKGINSTIFAYGQTGSGKTYTMYGDENEQDPIKMGVCQRAIIQIFDELKQNSLFNEVNNQKLDQIDEQNQDGFNDQDVEDDTNTLIQDIEKQTSVFLCIYQIYNENINDLLNQKDKQQQYQENLKIRMDAAGNHYVESLTQIEVFDYRDVFQYLKRANKKRTSYNTSMNELSSRSHLIISITLNRIDERDGSIVCSKINFVDLAGCERVKLSQVQGQQLKEAGFINKSLFTLASVVDSLQKGQQHQGIINYRDSKLTLLLRDSLGGNCRTTLLAMLSPSQQFCQESNNTCQFAHRCMQIQNTIKSNKYKTSIPASIQVKKKNPVKIKLPWQIEQNQLQLTEFYLNSKKFGDINILKTGDQNWQNKIILLHGCPSSNKEFYHQFPVYNYIKYQVFAIDMPGYGKSNGKCMSSRSENVLVDGGPADVVKFVMKELEIVQPVVVGFDWGGSIALKMGIQNQRAFQKIIVLHPSYNEEVRDELKQLKIPTLVQWVKQDQNHPWNKWKSLAKKIPNVVIDVFDVKPFKPEHANDTYKAFHEKIMVPIVKFLTGIDPIAKQQEVFQAQTEQIQSTNGQNVISINNIMLAQNLSMEEMINLNMKTDKQKEAVQLLKKLINDYEKNSKIVVSRINLKNPNREIYQNLIRQLSDVDPNSLADPNFLLELGIISALPKSWQMMMDSQRYIEGRNILVSSYVKSINPQNQNDYMVIQNYGQEKFISHKASIKSIKQDTFIITDSSGKEYSFHKQEIYTLNQPHIFAKDILGNLVFEDGLKCDYKSIDVKSKMVEICIKLAPLIEKLDFSNNPLNQQIECVQCIRSCLNFITFNKGNEKIVDTDRYKTGSVGKLAHYGQGNCHGCSSVMAAFLYPFSKIIGIELKYRGGYSFNKYNDDKVSNDIERHQWLEFTCRPSMQSFTLDLWYEGVNNGNKSYLSMPIDQSYSNLVYPNGRVILGAQVDQILN